MTNEQNMPWREKKEGHSWQRKPHVQMLGSLRGNGLNRSKEEVNKIADICNDRAMTILCKFFFFQMQLKKRKTFEGF